MDTAASTSSGESPAAIIPAPVETLTETKQTEPSSHSEPQPPSQSQQVPAPAQPQEPPKAVTIIKPPQLYREQPAPAQTMPKQPSPMGMLPMMMPMMYYPMMMPGAASMPELPKGWKQLTDPTTNAPYFWNKKTGETSWYHPAYLQAGAAAAIPSAATTEMAQPVVPTPTDPVLQDGSQPSMVVAAAAPTFSVSASSSSTVVAPPQNFPSPAPFPKVETSAPMGAITGPSSEAMAAFKHVPGKALPSPGQILRMNAALQAAGTDPLARGKPGDHSQNYAPYPMGGGGQRGGGRAGPNAGGRGRGGRGGRQMDELDPMDPSSYSDAPRGTWRSGLAAVRGIKQRPEGKEQNELF